ncbi:O-sialoglycoprotein endopeptidase [Phascolarctobacterium sp.]|uniref:Kae1-like domain-containing protein n=1 Tax=Phascolarctobacterium sp. TaxID=2049039 RepID=UPI002A81CAD7|nr:O-sialoglycoprotein endopeptidase [Phascolarctobacterium sp.]MDY5045998.1 O-sialoglycoprotein endopeptidase [Phascolarctobacterium sp.]
MSQRVYLGIDTSCYTTSVAIMDEAGALLGEARQILSVRPGRCGLQQSEMVFQHTRNLPRLMEEAVGQVIGCVTTGAGSVANGVSVADEASTAGASGLAGLAVAGYELAAIGVSGYPRPLEGSYMPAFLAGLSVARSVAAVTGAQLEVISHQENHLEAGLWSAGGPDVDRFLLLHASGGTTDVLLAERQQNGRYRITEVGGSMDLHAGQFVDRIGVALGLQFPTGPALEALAEKALARTAEVSASVSEQSVASVSEAGAGAAPMVELPVSVRKLQVSLSGPCTAALRKLEAGAEPAALALGVEHALAETFARVLRNGAQEYRVRDVLLVGGVGSNNYIRQHVERKLAKLRYPVRLWVPEGRFSCDNATGCAAFARRMNV